MFYEQTTTTTTTSCDWLSITTSTNYKMYIFFISLYLFYLKTTGLISKILSLTDSWLFWNQLPFFNCTKKYKSSGMRIKLHVTATMKSKCLYFKCTLNRLSNEYRDFYNILFGDNSLLTNKAFKYESRATRQSLVVYTGVLKYNLVTSRFGNFVIINL